MSYLEVQLKDRMIPRNPGVLTFSAALPPDVRLLKRRGGVFRHCRDVRTGSISGCPGPLRVEIEFNRFWGTAPKSKRRNLRKVADFPHIRRQSWKREIDLAEDKKAGTN